MITLLVNCFIQVRIIDIIDIVLVASLFYALYNMLKGNVAINIFVGIVAIALIYLIVDALNMKLLGLILGAFINVGFIALIIIFQPEIRRFLFSVGTNKIVRKFFTKARVNEDFKKGLGEICEACQDMSRDKVGALIAITRDNKLSDIISTGVTVNADISHPLIENIFFKNSPLHDGALIVSDNRLVAARCILPVSKQTRIPGHYGLRHRAAVGLSEVTDSVLVVVSEETGGICISTEGNIRKIKAEKLFNELESIFSDDNKNTSKPEN